MIASGGGPVAVRVVPKPWGHEVIWAHTAQYVGKLLHIKAGHALSLQYHELKDETIHLLRGRMLYRVGLGADCTEREMREMKKRVPATRREPLLPPVGESVRSGNRMSEQEGAEMRGMMRRKMGGLAAMPKKGC